MPFLLLVFIITIVTANAQERPPRPITVTVNVARQLQFGSFIQTGSYGTVTVDYTNTRSATGSIILPNISSSAFPTSALFIVDAEPGTLITIENGQPVELTGNHGGKITLTLGEASTRSPFVTRDRTTEVFIGGTLEVQTLSANPAGSYSGTFQVTFIQQ
ncbi:MAG: DUF4402 domain-containing protein [Bacteroidales bacterium]